MLLGDAAAMTDGVLGSDDDRWVYTEDNPNREMSTATNLAASARVLRGFNDTLATHCESIAEEIFANVTDAGLMGKIHAASELYQTTGKVQYFDFIIGNWDSCVNNAGQCAWYLAPVERQMAGQKKYRKQCAAFREALLAYREVLDAESADWSYIPGGVVSGTALIRPDFPELLVFPYLWQQVEYVLGGGSSHYMFLVLASKDLL